MPFQKGHKAGYRKDKPNKRTKQWQNFVIFSMDTGLAKFQREMEKLEGKEYITAFINILEFHKPKLARVENTHEGEINHNISTTTIFKIATKKD